jgi:protease II
MLTGSIEASRLIQGQLHMDPFASYEDSKSNDFKDAVKEELHRWDVAKKPERSLWRRRFATVLEKGLPQTKDYAQSTVQWYNQPVYIQDTYNHLKNVWFDTTKTYTGITALALGTRTYAIIEDTGEGSEIFSLSVYDEKHHRLWDATPVGPDVAYKNGKIYFQTVENRLRYPGIHMADELTGETTEIFHEPNPQVQVELLQPPFQDTIFIKTANALQQRLGQIVGSSEIKWLTAAHHTTLKPVSNTIYLSDTVLHSRPNRSLPKHEYGVDAIIYKDTIYVITVKQGYHTLYEVKDIWKKILSSPALRFLKSNHVPAVQAEYHWKPSEVVDILTTKLTLKMPNLLTLDHMEGTVQTIPYTIVYKGKPKKLIVSAYGAYGIESQRSYPLRWLPWIEKGYAFAVAMPRGGRDDGDHWWDEARTAVRKHRTFEDTATAIEAIQKRLQISPQKTIFYGRSAGGWVAAMMALQYPTLVRGVIAEVPYVDVLRTTSNPELPLTQLEYNEFGDPLHTKADYQALLRISPIDITSVPPPNPPTIVIKTALHDTQVATYESLKWAATLREKGWPGIYVNIDTQGGHFVGKTAMADQYAEDAAFFQSVFSARRRRTFKLANHIGKGTTRRSTSSSKH